MLVEMIESRAIAPGRALDVGCGTGTDAIYLAQHGFEVVGGDISPLAVENARAKARGCCRFETVDFLNEAARRAVETVSTAAAFTRSTKITSARGLRGTWPPCSPPAACG